MAVDADSPEVAAAVAAAEKADQFAGPANQALREQIQKLHQAEQFQRARFEQMEQERQMRQARLAQMQPPTLEQTMEFLKERGVPLGDRQMLLENKDMLRHLNITDRCASEALASGLERDTEPYRDFIRQKFTTVMQHLQQQAGQDVPEPFRPSPPPAPQPQAQTRAAITSAPVSREVASGNGERYQSHLSQVHLSADERAIASASGISDREYALNKLKLQKLKREGSIQP
jgi:hypothetical protein